MYAHTTVSEAFPAQCNIPNSGSNPQQKERYQIFSNQIQKVHNEGKEFIILTDENLNSLDYIGNSSYCRNIELKNIRDYDIINYDLT